MLTKSEIDRTKCTGKVLVLWDDELPGFGCRLHPTGRRSFVVKYRLPGDRKVIWATLGHYGVLTVSQARAKARDVLKDARTGIDPQADRKARATASAAVTVDGLVKQYSATVRAGMARTSRSRGQPVAAYVDDTIRHLERFAAIYGKEAAGTITRGDVVAALNEYAGQPSAHRRMHGAINRMFAWARRAELVANNPTDDIDTVQVPARERVLSLEELAMVWQAAEGLEPVYRDLVQLMILTGQRKSEVAGMVWGEIDLARALWILPGDRTKARRQHVVPLPAMATAILEARRSSFQRPPATDDLVLPTISRDGRTIAPISGWNWLKRELDRQVQLAPWRLHDFRRSLVTLLAERGADVAVLDSLLNHASSVTRAGVIGVYQRATLIEPMRKLMAIWDELLSQALDSGKVVRLPARR